MLLHGFEHGGLGLGRRAVDLVRQHDVGEERALHELEVAAAPLPLLEDVRARDVHGHQVRRELDPAEAKVQGLGEPADQQGLRQARHAHEQRVPLGEEADGELLDDASLTDDHSSEFFDELVVRASQLVDRLGHRCRSTCPRARFQTVTYSKPLNIRQKIVRPFMDGSATLGNRPPASDITKS